MNPVTSLNSPLKRGLAWSASAVGVIALLAWLDPLGGARSPREPQEGQTRSEGFGPRECFQSASLGFQAKALARSSPVVLQEVPAPPASPVPPPPSAATPGQSQMLIRTGDLRVEVADFQKAMAALSRIAKDAGGYVADTERERRASGTLRGTAVLRIPADRLEQAGEATHALGKVLAESSQVEDVTKAFSDLEAKLAVRQESAKRVRELLRHQAGNLKEVLEAEKELTRLQEEIEGLEGERRFTLHQVRLTTLRVSLEEAEPLSLTRPSSWSVLREAASGAALVLAESLAAMLRVALALLPWGLVVGAVLWRLRRRRRLAAPASGA